MAKKREKVTTDYFGALEQRQNELKEKTKSVDTEVIPSPTPSKRQERLIQISTYLREGQEEELEKVATMYNEHHNLKKPNKVKKFDVLRYLIDTISTEQILRAEIQAAKRTSPSH